MPPHHPPYNLTLIKLVLKGGKQVVHRPIWPACEARLQATTHTHTHTGEVPGISVLKLKEPFTTKGGREEGSNCLRHMLKFHHVHEAHQQRHKKRVKKQVSECDGGLECELDRAGAICLSSARLGSLLVVIVVIIIRRSFCVLSWRRCMRS